MPGPAVDRAQQRIGAVRFVQLRRQVELLEVRVGERMVAQRMPFAGNAARQLGMRLDLAADQEKAGFGLVLRQQFEQWRGVFGMRI